MVRRKGEIRFSTRVREYPFAALLQIDHRTRWRQLQILDGIATRMTNGDFLTSAPWVSGGIGYHFRRSDQAHAMEILGEANTAPYDTWAERLESHASSMESTKETADLINAAAATGALQRLFRWDGAGHREQVAWLREIEPGFSQMDADWAVMLMRHAIEWG
jgi:hypothetical protein